MLTELVLDMIGRKTRETKRKAAYRQKQREAREGGLSHGTHAGQSGDGHGNDTGVAQDSGRSDDTTTTTTTTDMSLSLERDRKEQAKDRAGLYAAYVAAKLERYMDALRTASVMVDFNDEVHHTLKFVRFKM